MTARWTLKLATSIDFGSLHVLVAVWTAEFDFVHRVCSLSI